MTPIVFSIDDSNGAVKFLVNSDTAPFIDDQSKVRRASHVYPCNVWLRIAFVILRTMFGDNGAIAEYTRNWNCKWFIDLSPVNGPKLTGNWTNRQDALDAEILWLNEYFL